MNLNKVIKKIPQPIRHGLNRVRYRLMNMLLQSKPYEFKYDQLFWFDKSQNFGDWVGPYLFEKITGKKPSYSLPSNHSKYTTIIAVGSIISWIKKNTIVWGAGIMTRDLFFLKPNKVLAVRGKITRKRFLELGYSCPEVYGDPALLLPKYFSPQIPKEYKVGIIPHYVDYKKVIKANLDSNVRVINVLDEVENVVLEMLKCDFIISSSLHGVIISHAYKIPVAWVEFSENLPGDGVKFLDHYSVYNVDDIKPLNYSIDFFKKSTDDLIEDVKNYCQPDYHLFDSELLLRNCPFVEN